MTYEPAQVRSPAYFREILITSMYLRRKELLRAVGFIPVPSDSWLDMHAERARDANQLHGKVIATSVMEASIRSFEEPYRMNIA